VLGVGRAAPVAEEQDFMPPLERRDQDFDHLDQHVGMVANEPGFDFGAVFEGLEDFFFHKIDLGEEVRSSKSQVRSYKIKIKQLKALST
jgi:hypothetical protein